VPARNTGLLLPLVLIGRIGRAHGVHGEIALVGASLTATELENVGTFVWRGPSGKTLPLTLERVRPAHRRLLVGFAGFGDRDRARTLAGGELLADSGLLPDPGPGLAYTFQLIGFEVRDEHGRLLGKLVEILGTGERPIYVVRGERELLVPAGPEMLKNVDLAAGRITVTLPPGLENL
jgi:16S rRNA processing protein RimM